MGALSRERPNADSPGPHAAELVDTFRDRHAAGIARALFEVRGMNFKGNALVAIGALLAVVLIVLAIWNS